MSHKQTILSPPSSATRKSRVNHTESCVLITGATGGLGAHLAYAAALRPHVTRVVCLNRRSKQDPQQRQDEAFRLKGLQLSAECLAKVEVVEANLTQPNLGLSAETYTYLLDSVTDIIHNAWLMHSKWPVRRFEPQLRIMANMLNLARDISVRWPQSGFVTFEFVSSIATVGYHPLWTGKPVVTEERVPIQSVLPTGYGEAKYICERMLDATLHLFPEKFRATTVRLGQIAGSNSNGHWNPMEHVSFIIKSSQTLQALPALSGSMGWTSSDDIADTLVDIIMQPKDVKLYPIYHVENPIRQPWCDIIDRLAQELNIPQDETHIIPFEQWIEQVRSWPRSEDNSAEGDNPAHLLIDFLDSHFARMSCGGLLLGTTRAREHSPTLAMVGPISKDLMSKFVKSWKSMGFLKK